MILKPKKAGRGPLAKFYGWFNRVFGKATNGYVRVCGAAIRKMVISLLLLVVMTVGTGLIGGKVPGGFLPEEDQGYMYAGVQLPDASSLQRTEAAVSQMEKIIMATPGVEYLHGGIRLQHAERRHQHLQRLLLHHPQTLGGTEKTGGEV